MELSKRKNRISKYPFAHKQVGETFDIKRSDVASMKTSLKAYNSRHGETVEIDYCVNDAGSITVTRIA